MATATLKEKYATEILPQLQKELGFENAMQVPRIEKIVLNTGVGTGKDKDALDEAVQMLATITGQRPVVTKARKSISNFKLREGMPVGASVTLRGELMYNFLNRLINIVLPRVRDFRGISPKAFDGFGNYTFGLTDQSVFTEIDLDKMKNTIGMNITIVTSAQTNDEGRALLKLFGMPFAS
jgi:large subunit ribosomal protein L5